MKNVYKYFDKLDINKLSHSFLIGNTDYKDISDDLEKTLSVFFFKKNVKLDEYPDIYILNKESDITKDQLKQLLNDVSTTSQFNNKKVYIINNFENLSGSVYNAILKTLEEPKDGIYAFLITNNINSINPTITSRCQKIFISSGNEISGNEEYVDIANKIITMIEKNGIKTIGINYDIYNIIKDKNSFKLILENMLNIYSKTLRNRFKSNEVNDIIVNNNTSEDIIKKILIINDKIVKLNYNLNKNLLIDRFIIEMWGCKNEGNRC